MATKTSKVKVALEASGGNQVSKELDRVGKATERVGKNQTRLGQASASAGRSFAAQSQGLGGVVGVYAAAAANVFALTAAFTALNRAAQFETIIRGTEQLANAVGSSSQRVIRGLQDITNGQLSIVEAATQANLALSAGFNSQQINELAEVSLKASRALGRNLTDSFQRITRGAIKLEPELLDEIGIFTRIEPAVEAYAASLNKSASQLTQFERRQAFVNQVIKDGQRAFADITDTGETTQEVFEKLVANFQNLAIQAGLLVTKGLEPVAKFLDQSLGNRIVLLGSVALLVFNSLRTGLSSFVVGGFTQLNEVLERTAQRFTKVNVQSATFASQAQEAAGAFVGGGAFQGAGRGTGANLKRRLAEGNIGLRETRTLRADVKLLAQNELNLQEAINKNRKQGADLTGEAKKQLEQSQKRQQGLTAAAEVFDKRIKSAGKGANILAGGLNLAAAAAKGIGTALSAALGLLNIFVAVLGAAQLVFSFFGVDLFSEISEFVQSFGKDARDTAAGLDELANAYKRIGRTAGEVGVLFSGLDPQAVIVASRAAEELTKQQSGAFAIDLSLEEQLKSAISKYNEAKTSADKLAAATEIAGIRLAQSGALPTLEKQGLAITRIAELSERSGSIIADSFVKGGLLKISDDGKTVVATLGDVTQKIGTFEDGTFTTTKALSELGTSAADSQQKIQKLAGDLDKGIISAEIASRDLITIRTLIEAVSDGNPRLAAELKKLLKPTEDVADQFIKLDQIAKSIRKQFSGDITIADTAVLKGLVSAGGEFARTQEEAQANRAVFLSLTKQTLESLIKEKGEQANINAARDAYLASQKAAFGFNVKNVIKTSEQTKEEQKRLDKLKQQNNILKLQSDLATKQAAFEAAKAVDNLALKNSQNALTLDKKSLDIIKEEFKVSERQAKSQKEFNDALRESLAIQQRLVSIRAEGADATAAAAEAQAIRAIEVEKEKAERTGFASRRQLVDLEIKLEQARTTARIKELERSEAQAIREAGSALLANQSRREALLEEVSIRKQSLRNSLSVLEKEIELSNTERGIEIRKQENIKTQTQNQLNALDDSLAITKAQIEASKQDQLAQLGIIDKKYEFLKAEIIANNKFLAEESTLINGLLDGVAALTGAQRGEAITAGQINVANIEKSQALLDQSSKLIGANAELQADTAKANTDKQRTQLQATINAAQAEIDLLNDLATKEKELNGVKKDAIQDEITGVKKTLAQRLKNLVLEDAAVLETLNNKLIMAGLDKDAAEAALATAKEQAEYALTFQARFDSALSASKGIVEDYVSGGLMELNDALIEGTFTFKDLARGFRDMLQNMLKDIQRAVFQETVSKPIAQGISEFLPKIFAAGGKVHLAAGGSLKRDRVAAMLEPGEFVIRKEAAKKLGMSQLQKMNAGVEPDPLARLIAMFSGSKVVQKRAGGGLTAGEAIGAVTDDDALGFLGKAAFGKAIATAIPPLAVPLALMGGLRAASRLSSAASMKKTTAGTRLTKEQFDTIYGTGSMGGAPTSAAMATMMSNAPGLAATPGFSSVAESLGRGGGGGGTDFGIGGNMAAATSPSGSFGAKDSTGGARRFAAGGSVSSRDRVPALLEPGEFVIRRPMAKAIGGAALNQMNATGTPPQISVNLNNSGAPKDVQVATPRMNGDKIILDIITRDLRNNGAIKKSLRRNR